MIGGASAHGTGGNPVYEYIRFRGSLPSAVAEAVENVSAGSCRNHGAPPSRRQIILIALANRQTRDRRREALLAHRLGQKYG
jgi:hypothetical protein